MINYITQSPIAGVVWLLLAKTVFQPCKIDDGEHRKIQVN